MKWHLTVYYFHEIETFQDSESLPPTDPHWNNYQKMFFIGNPDRSKGMEEVMIYKQKVKHIISIACKNIILKIIRSKILDNNNMSGYV